MAEFPRTLIRPDGAEVVLDPAVALVALRDDPRAGAAPRDRLVELGLLREQDAGGKASRVNNTAGRAFVSTAGGAVEDLPGRLEQEGVSIDWVGPVYRDPAVDGPGGRFAPLPNVLLIRAAGRADIDEVAGELGLRRDDDRSALLGEFDYYVVAGDRSAFEVREELRRRLPNADVRFENMPMIVPTTAVPDDPFFPQQWNMTRIGAPAAWDIETGDATVVVAVLDEGVDQTHPDLRIIAGGGINLGTMTPPGAPTGSHGTACAGLAAAIGDNAVGVAGVAGGCTIMPIAFQSWTDAECAAGINYAAANGAHVLSMSFGVYGPGEGMPTFGWDIAVVDPALVNAAAAGVVLVAATGNEDIGTLNRYPARSPLCIAVGGTDTADNRKSPASPDGECWGANFGPEISVAAPCVTSPTTDIQGTAGYNVNGGAMMVACASYASSGDAAGDYFALMNGTSAATPQVAGVAALLRSRYPGLTRDQIRNVIERTAAKVGGAYADAPGFPNGTRTAGLGYGRLDAARALDFADVFIRDYPLDDGTEPSTPPGGVFWATSDIVIRPADDNVFTPADEAAASRVRRGQQNYLYVRVTNSGPADARNVVADARITAYAGTEFSYPGDWTAVDATHVQPSALSATFPVIPAGTSVVAKFAISATQVEQMWTWSSMAWHPCILAMVTADNDHAFPTASTAGTPITMRRNNLAQRNVTVVPALTGSVLTFPFVVGSAFSDDRIADVVVDRGRIPHDVEVLLDIDPRDDVLPHVRAVETPVRSPLPGVEFVDRTRLRVKLGTGLPPGLLTLEPGSKFLPGRLDALSIRDIVGGELVAKDGARAIKLVDRQSRVRIEKDPNALVPMALRIRVPQDAQAGEEFTFTVRQLDSAGRVLGGVTLVAVTEPAGMLDRVTDRLVDRLENVVLPR